ncbi:kinase-like domain-containing protein [Nemania sp. NC0429]|nr:kinase-like domain-containing protein [Nemania sp. NC0429]
MACSTDPLILFFLVPMTGNKKAQEVVSHPNNAHRLSITASGEEALAVGFHFCSKSSTTLATLGRSPDADIYMEGSSVARIQCSFEIDLDTGIVMLHDRSHGLTTQVSGQIAYPFEYGRVRQILVRKNLNTILGMCGSQCNLIRFKLEWNQGPTQMAETIKKYKAFACGRVENPRLALTQYEQEIPTDMPSRHRTRPHTAGRQKLIRYAVEGSQLGSGQFGIVYKAIDVDLGKLMAVKVLEKPASTSKQREWESSLYYALKREVEILSEINHPHIVDYIGSQGWDGPQIEIFMGLKTGTVESLVESGADTKNVAVDLLPQMLKALDCLACQGIVHRDVKPENILYTVRQDGHYQFQLGDFGLCNRAVDAKTQAGSPLYMAAEMYQKRAQTHKVDVWSLFVTIMWILDADDFRQKSSHFKSMQEVWDMFVFTAANVG